VAEAPRAGDRRTAGPPGSIPLFVGLACLAVTLGLYHRALGLHFVGDDIGFVRPDPHWLRNAFLPAGEWHYYPLTQATFALLGRWSDWQPAPLHLLNLALHSAVGLGLALWLSRFGIPAWARVVAALFFISRGIHYEVVLWITELSYLGIALYTLLTLACWDRFLRGHGRPFLIGAVLGFAAAVLTIEHALILSLLYLLYDFIMGPRGVPFDPASRWSRLRPRALMRDAIKYVPFLLVALAFLAVKRSFHLGLTWSSVASAVPALPTFVPSGMDLNARLPDERIWLGFLNTPGRAYQDLLSATSYLFFPSGLAHGADDNWLTRHPWLCLLPWLGIQLWIAWKGRPLARFLLAWIYVYELPLAIAGVPQARYHYMASIPASALLGLGVIAASVRLARWRWKRISAATAAVLFGAMILGEARFIRARLQEWTVASDMVRSSVAELRRGLAADTEDLYLLNLPSGVPSPYWPAYAFANAAAHLPLMLRPPRWDVRTHVVYDRSLVAGRWPTIGRYAPRDTIVREAGGPTVMAYEFVDHPPWITRLR